MIDVFDAEQGRRALTELPEGTSYAEGPNLAQVYLPPSHLKAMDPDNMLVTGMRGAGKTFWWSALRQPEIRQLIDQESQESSLSKDTEVRIGFGVSPALDDYPDKDTIKQLLQTGAEPRTIWRTVQAWQLGKFASDDLPIRKQGSWKDRLDYVGQEPEAIARLFQDSDIKFEQKGTYLVLLFDALDRCSDDWKDMYRLIRGLMQTALDMRSYRRLRVKMFLRSDQVNDEMADFPDASKILSSSVDLSWPASELYGLLWHSLVNGNVGKKFREFIGGEHWDPVQIGQAKLFSVSRRLISKDRFQRDKFHGISGPFMGRDRRRGFPYTWIPNHLGDTEGRVSPRSFFQALRTAAKDTAERYREHRYTLHYESIKRGVQAASQTRVAELKEDYPWVHPVLECLDGMTVPCKFEEIETRWKEKRVLSHLVRSMEQDEVKLPPLHIAYGGQGVRRDLESLGVFLRMRDDRVNIPDVFRVGYGLGRKGGVRVAR